jgi:hypothetical protein
MSVREKIILALALGSLLYGGYEVFWRPAPPGRPASSPDAEPLAGFINRISAETAAGRLTLAERALIRRAEQAWPDRFESPTLPPPAFERLPVYSGFIRMRGRTMAIIDGREYGVGERLETSGYRVREISPGRIVIGGEGRRDIPIPLQELEQGISR